MIKIYELSLIFMHLNRNRNLNTVLIYGALREFIWHDSPSSPGPITVQKKNQPIKGLVCVIRGRAHLLFLFFFLSQHVRDVKNWSEDYEKKNKPFFVLRVYWMIKPLSDRLSSKFHICPWSFASRAHVYFSDNLSAEGSIEALLG